MAGRALTAMFAMPLLGSGCSGDGTPPRRVDVKASVEVDAAVDAPPGARYGFDASCEKCERTRGEGCVFRIPGREPLGCGWVAPEGKRAAVAWVTRGSDNPHTVWWYGSQGETTAFWTPCRRADCSTTISWSTDRKTALVAYGVGTDRSERVRFDVDAGEPVAK